MLHPLLSRGRGKIEETQFEHHRIGPERPDQQPVHHLLGQLEYAALQGIGVLYVCFKGRFAADRMTLGGGEEDTGILSSTGLVQISAAGLPHHRAEDIQRNVPQGLYRGDAQL